MRLVIALMIALFPAALGAKSPGADQRIEGRRVLTEFAGCIAKYEPEMARRYILSDEELPKDQFAKLVDKRCLKLNRGSLKMDSFFFRGALAQRMIANGTFAAAEDFSQVPSVVYIDQTGDPQVASRLYAMRLGECVARRNPAKVLALFSSQPDSKAEVSSFAVLSDEIMACVPAGQEVRIGKASLRSGMATIYARMAETLRTRS